ncbi:MAG: diguanylate cyclase (GGDEF)-like protein [Pseudohongiellaceae bacterium]|jgi:diguanylate cyclase (GGDEF)-like protein
MFVIGKYQVIEQLYRSAYTVVYRAKSEDSDPTAGSVILKLLNEEFPSPECMARFRREYELTKMVNSASIIKVYDLFRYQNTLVMVQEDFKGASLADLFDSSALPVDQFLPLAISVAEALAELHRFDVIHKGINPSNILFNPATNKIRIIDLGLATEIPFEPSQLMDPAKIEGSLAFISPEQTGRINRPIDHRSDYYSLGMTYYQLLTGTTPFQSADPMQWIHWHIAQEAEPPGKLNPSIPDTLSKIVMKLLSKTAEERYASLAGLIHDLKRCWKQFQENGDIAQFEVSSNDISNKLQIPKTLYGRTTDLNQLISSFDQTVECKKVLISVVGPSGIGKSCFVRELSKPLLVKRGFFIEGKFDQLDRSTPYSCFISAIKDLIAQILGLDDSRITKWKKTILQAIGQNGKLITDVIPELEPIIGPQAEMQTSSAAETKNRFNVTFQRFVRAFCSTEHPLVMFLDDLQWADLASLKLVEQLMLDSTIGHMLIIASYRNNEVNSLHPVSMLVNELVQQNIIVTKIELHPLSLDDIKYFLSDTFQCNKEHTTQLAERCLTKTHGNPFFLIQFLKHLNKQWLVQFDHLSNTWCWDIDKIDRQHTTDNVIDLMVEKIRDLSPTAYQLACSGACIGNQFDLNTLAAINFQTPENTANSLKELLKAGLLTPIDDRYDWIQYLNQAVVEAINPIKIAGQTPSYRFAHDRIQHAAYSLLPDADKHRIHLSVGQSLLASHSDISIDVILFNVAKHLNLAASFSKVCSNPTQLAELNLRSGKKAKASAAFESAFQYLNNGIEIVNESHWSSHYQLMLQLHTETIELACINADFETMETLASTLMNNADALIDKIPVYETRIRAFISKDDSAGAVKEALQALKLLDVDIMLNPQFSDVEQALVAVGEGLSSRAPMSLMDLPEMNDPHLLAAMRILNQILSAAYQSSPLLFPIIVSNMIQLSIKHGNCPGSTFAYSSYGLVLCGVVGDIETGYQFGQLSIKLLEHLNTDEFKAKTLYGVYVFVYHWKQHIDKTITPLKNIFQLGLTHGDFEYAGWAGMMINVHAFFAGKPIDKLEKESREYLLKIKQINQNTAYLHTCIFIQTLSSLKKPFDEQMLSGPPTFYGNHYSEQDSIKLHCEGNDQTALCIEHLNRMLLLYLLNNYEDALKQSEEAEHYLDGLVSSVYIPVFYFFDSLIRLALCCNDYLVEGKIVKGKPVYDALKTEHLEKVEANQQKLSDWAELCPENFSNKYQLVEAERSAVMKDRSLNTIEAYQSSISLAMGSGFLHEEAVANERLAEYLLANNQPDIAKVYLTRAFHLYQQWGAESKLGQLQHKHPLLLGEFYQNYTTKNTNTALQLQDEQTSLLDFYSIMKATQAISGEIVLQNLLETMMNLVLENAGGKKGYLLLAHEPSNVEISWSLEVIAHAGGPTETNSSPINFETESRFPVNIVQTVIRTNAPLVLANASTESQFSNNEYIETHQPKSVLCSPVVNRGKLSGIVYLENASTIGAFSEDHLNTVQLLSTQTAISLENAKLYANLEERVISRTQDLREANEKLTFLATTDSLTNSLNRRHFLERSKLEVERALRFNNSGVVIMMDIDNFKKVNDTYGHAVGDEALRQVASISKSNLREQDLFGRMGGEEFAILAPESTLDEGLQLAERIRRSIAQTAINVPPESFQITISIGITVISQTYHSIEQLLQLADKGLYLSKETGKNRVSAYRGEV